MKNLNLNKLAVSLGSGLLFASAAVAPVLAAAATTTAETEAASAFAASMFAVLILAFYVFIGVALCLGLVMQIYLIVDATQRNFGNEENAQLMWIVILLFVGFPVGTLLYYFMVMKKYPKKS